MKIGFLLFILSLSASADMLDGTSVKALRAMMEKPTESHAFHAKTVLTEVEVTEEGDSTVYTFSGKRRAIGNGGYRALVITEATNLRNGTTSFSANLIK